MKNLLIITMVVFSTNLYSQSYASSTINLPKGQVMTETRNGKAETNVWMIKEDRWLYYNDKIYPFTKDVKGSTLTKMAGWIILGDKQYRVVLFIQVTSIEIYDNTGKRVNVFD